MTASSINGLGPASGFAGLSSLLVIGIVLYCFIYGRTSRRSQATFLVVYVSQILDGTGYENR